MSGLICWWRNPEGIPQSDVELLEKARKSFSGAYDESDVVSEPAKATLHAINTHKYHMEEYRSGIL